MKNVEKIVNPTIQRYSHLFDQDTLLQTMHDQMTDYRLTFPTIISQGRYIQIIALLASSSDPRMVSLLRYSKLTLKTDADLVFLCLGYENPNEWESKAKNIVRIFPEQRDAPEGVFMGR
jgi:hypothetical protein